MNPVSAVPLYLSVTSGCDREHRRTTLRAAILTSIVVLVAFAFAGTWILELFGVTTTTFRITGGLLFLAVGSSQFIIDGVRAVVLESTRGA